MSLSRESIESVVNGVLKNHPIPDTPDELDPMTKRQLYTEAQELGISPHELLNARKAIQDNEIAKADHARVIAASIAATARGQVIPAPSADFDDTTDAIAAALKAAGATN